MTQDLIFSSFMKSRQTDAAVERGPPEHVGHGTGAGRLVLRLETGELD